MNLGPVIQILPVNILEFKIIFFLDPFLLTFFFSKQLGGELLNGVDPIGKYQHPREISSPRLNFGTRHRIKVTQLRDLHNFSFVATILEKSVRNKFDKMTEEMNKFYLEVRKI